MKRLTIYTLLLLCPAITLAEEPARGTGSLREALSAATPTTTPPSDDALSIESYRERVLSYSLSLRQSSEQAEAVRHAMREAKTSFLPSLDFAATGQYRVTDYNLDMMGAQLSMRPESYSADINLQQVVYAGGAVKHGYAVAKLQNQIAQKSEELTRTNVIYSAQINYWGASAKSALLRLTNHYVKLIEELTSVIRERYNDGLISRTDLLQIESSLSSARIQRSEANKSYLLALQNLNIMMGVNPMQAVAIRDEINREDSIPQSVMSLEAVLDRRSEFSISESNVDLQLRQLKIQRSKFLPQFAIGMKAGWGTSMLNFDGATMWNSYVYASINVPIFRFGAKYKNVASQRALVRSREIDVQQMRDNISQELYAAYTSLQEYRKQITLAEESCDTARQSLELNTFSYNEGRLPIVDVLSAQVAWVQSNSALIQSWLQEKVAYIDYNKAIGNTDY